MPDITQEFIMERVAAAKPHSLVILRRGPNYDSTAHLQMAHLKHIFTLREAGQQVLTCPITDEGDIAGIALFALPKEEAAALTSGDPGVKAGRFTFEVLTCMGLPGDGPK